MGETRTFTLWILGKNFIYSPSQFFLDNMKITINITKKHVYALLILSIAFAFANLAIAITATQAFHPLQDIAKSSTDLTSVDANSNGIIDLAELAQNAQKLNNKLESQLSVAEAQSLTTNSVAAIVAGAYCQAKHSTNFNIYAVRRDRSSDGSCESACRNFFGDGLGHYTGQGVGDLTCTIYKNSAGEIYSIAGRPNSGYVEADTAYCDWCCCIQN